MYEAIVLTLRNFEIFVTVCDDLNMTEAAEGLYISQSAVSQAISELETHYGVRLFERFSRKLYLTSAGAKLYGYARHMIGLNGDIEKEMRALSENGPSALERALRWRPTSCPL